MSTRRGAAPELNGLVRIGRAETAALPDARLAMLEDAELAKDGGVVCALALMPDGERLAVSDQRGMLSLRDVTSGARRRDFMDAPTYAWLWSVAAHPDGRHLAVGGKRRTLEVYDAGSGRRVHAVRHRPSRAAGPGALEDVTAVAWLPDGKHLAALYHEGELCLVALKSGAVTRVVDVGDEPWALALAPRGRPLAIVGGRQGAALWDVGNGRRVRDLLASEHPVRTAAFAGAGRALLGDEGGTLSLVDVERGVVLRTLRAHAGAVRAIHVLEDGARAVTAGEDATLRVWDLASGAVLGSATDPPHEQVALVAAGPGRLASAGGARVVLWALERFGPVPERHTAEVTTIAVCPPPARERVVTGSRDGSVRVWDATTGRSGPARVLHDQVAWAAALPGGRRAVSGGSDRKVQVWSLAGGAPIRTFVQDAWVERVFADPSGRWVFSTDFNGHNDLHAWNLRTGAQLRLRSTRPEQSDIVAVTVRSHGREVVALDRQGSASTWDLRTGAEVEPRELEGEGPAVLAGEGRVAVLPAPGGGPRIGVFDIASGRRLRTLTGHAGEIRALAVSPDGKRLASAANDVRVWDLARGRLLHRLMSPHRPPVEALVWSSDGARIAGFGTDAAPKRARRVAGARGSVLVVWRTKDGAVRGSWRSPVRMTALAFTPGGRLVVGREDGEVACFEPR
jgi:WD40 repeat protein